MSGAGRQLAADAIAPATARRQPGGGAEAERVLGDGDALRAAGSPKAAVCKYRDALAKAEGA